jgi:serine/threonine protein kinase
VAGERDAENASAVRFGTIEDVSRATRDPTTAARSLEEKLVTVDPRYYDLEGEQGRGGLGRVLRAHDRRLGRVVAIKELLRSDVHARERFVREVTITARLQHPSIVPIHEAGQWPSGEPFYAMKLVEGMTLEQLLQKATTAAERIALLPTLLAVADAVGYAHSKGIIHRDLKPANILIGPFGETVVIDWGLAKELAEPDAASEGESDTSYRKTVAPPPGLTRDGSVVGTPAFMSPEQAAGRPVDERTDVYALGVIGQRILMHHDLRAPLDLRAILDKATAHNAEARYASAIQLASDLRRFSTGQIVLAYRYSALDRLRRLTRRHRTLFTTAAVAIVILMTVGVVSLRRVLHERDVANSARAALRSANDALILEHARETLNRDPATTLAWLKLYRADGPELAIARRLAREAAELFPATHEASDLNYGIFDLSPDRELLLTESVAGDLLLRRPTDLAILQSSKTHAKILSGAAVSRSTVLAGSATGELLRVSIASTTPTSLWKGESEILYIRVLYPDGAVGITSGGEVFYHSLVAGTTTSEHLGCVPTSTLEVAATGLVAVVGCNDGTVRLLDASRIARSIPVLSGPVSFVAISEDGTRVLAASDLGTSAFLNLSATGRSSPESCVNA